MKRIAFAALAWVIIPALSLFGATAEDIVRAMDQTETFTTSYAVGEIITTDRFGTKTSSFKAWTRGTDESLIEFTSTAEKRQKIPRTTAGFRHLV